MSGPLRRRRLLQLSGVATASGLAGCASVKAALGLRSQELGRVVLANGADESAVIDVQVRRDGEAILDRLTT
jgi:hypothetical protein